MPGRRPPGDEYRRRHHADRGRRDLAVRPARRFPPRPERARSGRGPDPGRHPYPGPVAAGAGWPAKAALTRPPRPRRVLQPARPERAAAEDAAGRSSRRRRGPGRPPVLRPGRARTRGRRPLKRAPDSPSHKSQKTTRNIKVLLRTPAAVPAIFAGTVAGPEFLICAHGLVPPKRHG